MIADARRPLVHWAWSNPGQFGRQPFKAEMYMWNHDTQSGRAYCSAFPSKPGTTFANQHVNSMKFSSASKLRGKFEVIAATRGAEAVMMTLAPKASSHGEISNEHPRSGQWLFVLSGSGTAIIRSGGVQTAVTLKRGSLLTIEKGELH